VRRFGIVTLTIATCLGVAVAPAGAGLDTELKPALLSPDNIPDDDWDTAPTSVIESAPRTQEFAQEGGWCGGDTDEFEASQLGYTGRATTALQKVASADEPYWFLWEQLYSFADPGDAKAFLESIRAEGFGVCPEGWTVGGEVPNQITPEEISWPKVGKQRLAVEVTTTGDGVTETSHVVYVRIANKVLSVHSRILPVDEALLKKIVKKAAKLLKKAKVS
jgi:hypothetical protein